MPYVPSGTLENEKEVFPFFKSSGLTSIIDWNREPLLLSNSSFVKSWIKIAPFFGKLISPFTLKPLS
jgi:hypothetical protein